MLHEDDHNYAQDITIVRERCEAHHTVGERFNWLYLWRRPFPAQALCWSHLKFKSISTTTFSYSGHDKMLQGFKVSMSLQHSNNLLIEQPRVSRGRFAKRDLFFWSMKMALTPCMATSQSTQRFWSYKFPFVSEGPFLQDRTILFKLIIFISPCSVWSHLKCLLCRFFLNVFFETA